QNTLSSSQRTHTHQHQPSNNQAELQQTSEIFIHHPVSEATFPTYQAGTSSATRSVSNLPRSFQDCHQAQDRYSTPTRSAGANPLTGRNFACQRLSR
ncbi:hypothetical protein, partial [Gordonia aichiensis]|uniref:hypothetical protein n=1 Tax=Gordonia aichiensis TaxID=36820 RepID=UPI0032665D45